MVFIREKRIDFLFSCWTNVPHDTSAFTRAINHREMRAVLNIINDLRM